MSWRDTLDRKFRRLGIPNITNYLILGQVLFFIFDRMGKVMLDRIDLVPAQVMSGEWWRIITFVFIPPDRNPIWAFFAWYLLYLIGNALENHWGTFRYNLFLLVGYLVTVAVSFRFPSYPATNIFIGESVFLAFAYLYPEFQLIVVILPVKIKWLALIAWIHYLYRFVTGSGSTRLLILASLSNFFVFFGKDIYLSIKSRNRRMVAQAREIAGSRQPFHTCAVCGITDISHPGKEFRYCPECGGLGYCMDHIFKHEHVKKK